MADGYYSIPENPQYRAAAIRKLLDTDPASATETFNPLISDVLESVEYLNKHKAELTADGKVPADQLPSMDYIPTSQKDAAGGVAGLDLSGKVPESQLPSMDYIPTDQKGAAEGVASLDGSGKVPSDQLPSMNYIPTSQKGAAGGVANLDGSGKVPTSQLPTLGGHAAQATAPSNTNLLWIDTASSNMIKFYDSASGTWKPVAAVWS